MSRGKEIKVIFTVEGDMKENGALSQVCFNLSY